MKSGLAWMIAASLASAPLYSQEEVPAPPPADPADVESIDAIMLAVYEVISGPAGEARDWDRMRSLFIPEAQLIPSGTRPDGSHAIRVFSVEGYIENAGPRLEEYGFFETEINRVVEQFGHVAHVFSTYESRRTLEDVAPFVRGINSFQLFDDGSRWWVVSIYWTGETSDSQIPEKYDPDS